MTFSFETIGIVKSCFSEKFGTPRQPGLIDVAEAVIELQPPYNQPDFVRELEAFSHLWVVFVFHQHIGHEIKATVRPPRLGGNKRLGVFATRSSFRPNPIGLSVVKLKEIRKQAGGVSIVITGVDVIDGTPVLDIKPYIPYTDSIPDAEAGYANEAPRHQLAVIFSDQVIEAVTVLEQQFPLFRQLITEAIALDPRPAYKSEGGEYGIKLYGYNLRWKVEGNEATVISLSKL